MGLLESKQRQEKEVKTFREISANLRKTLKLKQESSVERVTMYCDLCFPQSGSVGAVKFCQVCNRYLCEVCYETHKHSSTITFEHSFDEIGLQECLGEIKPRGEFDQEKCWISGMAFLSSGDLIVADGNNSNVKIIRVSNSMIISELVLPSGPFDIAVVSEYEVGVTLPEQQQIQYLGTLNGLSKTRRMKVNGHCFGIAQCNGLTAVTFLCPEKVEIITSEGNILKRIQTDFNGEEIFSAPYYIAFCNTGKYIYLSDHRNDSVMKFSTAGQMISVYRAGDLDRPEGLVVREDGNVVVASRDSNCLHVISSTCAKLKILKGKLERPWSVCFSAETNRLYVSNDDGKYINVYGKSKQNDPREEIIPNGGKRDVGLKILRY